MTAADTVCCTSNEEFGGRILKHPFLHFSHSLSESISHASFRCSSRREEPSDMTLNVDFTPCHSCKLINLDLTSGFHQPLWPPPRLPRAGRRRVGGVDDVVGGAAALTRSSSDERVGAFSVHGRIGSHFHLGHREGEDS